MLRAVLIIIQLVLIVATVRPHLSDPRSCVEYKYATVKLYSSRFVDLDWPWHKDCTKYYNKESGVTELVIKKR